jgi:transcriptional regulator with XRE-family HTH domain
MKKATWQKRLKRLMDARDWSISDTATAFDVSENGVRKWMAGGVKRPSNWSRKRMDELELGKEQD